MCPKTSPGATMGYQGPLEATQHAQRIVYHVDFYPGQCILFLGIFKHTHDIAKAFLSDVTAAHEQSKVFGWYNSISLLGFVLGPTISGHLAELPGGAHTVCVITPGIFIINLG